MVQHREDQGGVQPVQGGERRAQGEGGHSEGLRLLGKGGPIPEGDGPLHPEGHGAQGDTAEVVPRKRLSPMPLLFGTEPEFEIAEQ